MQALARLEEQDDRCQGKTKHLLQAVQKMGARGGEGGGKGGKVAAINIQDNRIVHLVFCPPVGF